VHVREMRVEDADAVAELLRHSFDRRLWPLLPYTQHGIAKYLSLPLHYPACVTKGRRFVLCDSTLPDEVLAFADFQLFSGGVAFLSYVATRPDTRRRGAASLLIEFFLASNPGVTELRLDAFRGNAAARALYSKLGFEAEPGKLWVSRKLPRSAGVVAIRSLESAMAAYQAYGFCEFDVLEEEDKAIRLGLIGSRFIRCFDYKTFENDRLLSAVRSVFPHAESAYAVLPESDASKISVDHQIEVSSERMTLTRTPSQALGVSS
jgi:ribosomal protein S18 acetylase RimI-like enzyme